MGDTKSQQDAGAPMTALWQCAAIIAFVHALRQTVSGEFVL